MSYYSIHVVEIKILSPWKGDRSQSATAILSNVMKSNVNVNL